MFFVNVLWLFTRWPHGRLVLRLLCCFRICW